MFGVWRVVFCGLVFSDGCVGALRSVFVCVCCVLLVVCCLVFGVRGSLFVVRCSVFVVWCLVFWCLVLVVCCSGVRGVVFVV